VALVEENVLRLDVAVDHPLAVRVVECLGDLAREADRLAGGEAPFTT